MKTLIIMPTHCEKNNIEFMLASVRDSNLKADILVVDDGSTDGTAEYVQRYIDQKHGHPVFLKTKVNREGLGHAYRTGFDWAIQNDYEVIVEMDADRSHRVSDLIRLLEKIPKYDFVVGSRYAQGGKILNWPFQRHLLSKFANGYARWLLGHRIEDLTSGFCVWRKHVLQSILSELTASGFFIQVELKYWAMKRGFQFCEVPITFENRKIGQSKMNIAIFKEGLFSIWRLRNSSIRN